MKHLAILVALAVLLGCGGTQRPTVTQAELDAALHAHREHLDAILAQQDASFALYQSAMGAFHVVNELPCVRQTFEARGPSNERQAALNKLLEAMEAAKVADARLTAAVQADHLTTTFGKLMGVPPSTEGRKP